MLEKQFKSVPNVVDVASFGGIIKEYQVRIDPDKLVDYGLSIGQVEQQLANNNVNAGGSFIEQGLQQVNVRQVGLVSTVGDELKMADGGKSRVVGISLKDRAAILLVGHMADAAYWFDNTSGNFVSSTYYFRELPGWVKDFDNSRPGEK